MQKPALPGKKLPLARARGSGVSEESLVRMEPLRAESPLPLVIRPAVDGVDLVEWVGSHRDELHQLLLRHGGILFRGFGVRGPEALGSFTAAVSTGPLEYQERSSPRTHVANRVYTSTEHPAEQEIFLHNEQSYNLTFPLKIIFACATAAEEGGATPVADVREVYRLLPEEIRRPFEEKGYTYVRNFGDGFGLPWQEAFQTDDPAEVEEYCRRNRIEVEWKDGGRLRTRQVRPAVARHPRSGEAAWFNHATFFHRTTLDPSVRAVFEAAFQREEDFPNNTLYGDGTPIDPEVAEALRRVYRECTVSFRWEEGDVLLLDNLLTAHAREPFRGPRKILTAMSDPFHWDDVARG
ncbi:MAG TPA: TauD/TfdA family dioxygenase [Longimicrobiaceae bacterium]|nr:TauD/TfdA family dioxygenase [Longimicrobiaceae bacterium]